MNNLPPVTKNLLIINVLCFFGYIVAQKYGIEARSLSSHAHGETTSPLSTSATS